MNTKWKIFRTCSVLLTLTLFSTVNAQNSAEPWSPEKAWEWYREQPWICGFNYIPASAINYTAMWDKTSFAPSEIDRELALAEEVGFNTVRVVLQYIVWEEDPRYFKQVFARFLSICRKHQMKVMPVLFDDCAFGANVDPSPGRQPEPLEGWYAWAWSPSPGHSMVLDPSTHDRLEKYVRDMIGTFRDSPDILAWDLYNEPSNTMDDRDASLPLVRKVYLAAREENPPQPLTICFFGNRDLQDFITAHSDITTVHSYIPVDRLEALIENLKQYGRPIICTEWLNRPRGSLVETVLPFFYREQIGCMHWGLVNGKTQTHLPWGHRPGDLPYQGIWQHDLYTNDHREYSPYEMKLFKKYMTMSKTADDR